MVRVTCAASSRAHRKRFLRKVKGFWGDRKNHKRQSRSALMKAMAYNYRDRKNRKRFFRQLWITRIGVAARACGCSYSVFMGALAKSGIQCNRKTLAEMAFAGDGAFALLASTVLNAK